MASKALTVTIIAGLALSTVACDKIKAKLGGQPKGQVVATVGGQEITSLELRNELNGFTSRDPKIMKAAQDQALQQIIMRNLLSQKARADKLDKQPQFVLQVRRGENTLLAQMYESKLFSSVSPPTPQEAASYVANNPDKFANRRMYVLDRIVAPAGRIDRTKLTGLKSLEEVKGFLDAGGIPYQDSIAVADSLTADAATIKGLDQLPPGEVIIFPSPNVFEFDRIASKRAAPFRGELAKDFAIQQLRRDQAIDFVRTQIMGIRRAAESSITYAKGYKVDNIDRGVAPVAPADGGQQGAQPGTAGAPAAPKS